MCRLQPSRSLRLVRVQQVFRKRPLCCNASGLLCARVASLGVSVYGFPR